jgi:hypothetical protein
MLFTNWLEQGYYEQDSSGEIYQLNNINSIQKAFEKDNLYEHDGISLTKVEFLEIIKNYNSVNKE